MRKKARAVVDSSVIVKWVNSVDEKYLEQSDKLADDCRKGKIKLLAPELAKYEVGNVLWKKNLDLPMAKASLGTVYASPVEFVRQNESQAMRALEIAADTGITFYDASFISLAESLEAELVTDNPKHQKKFGGVKVVALKDYE
jgi:predicted nucleic acid-binding protein